MDRIHPEGRLVTISFFGTVANATNKTLVSKKIGAPFIIRLIRASFAPGVNRTMTLKYFISSDDEAPTTTEPNGNNILAQTGQAVYITGDDEFKQFAQESESTEANKYVKVYAENADAFSHTIDTQVTIEILPRKEIKK